MENVSKTVKKNSKKKSFIKNYDENSNTGYFLEVDIDYPKELFSLHEDLPFLPKSKKVNKVEKLICSKEDKKDKSFKTSIKSRIKSKKGTQNNSVQTKSMVKNIY